jgi:hypothetical protein
MPNQVNKFGNDLDRPVWGAEAIGQVINRTRRETYHLLNSGKLDATKCGAQHVSTPRRLLRSLGMEA